MPIGSLPQTFRRLADDFPIHSGYLQVDISKAAEWRSKLAVDGRPVIGISWKGGLATTGKYQRSVDLGEMAVALGTTGARLVSLQYGDATDEIHRVVNQTNVAIEAPLPSYADLDELAAVTSACDVVITVCSTLAHLCGALGHPGYVLVPTAGNWRYGAFGNKTPWYPSLTLIRQSESGDWTNALAFAASCAQSRLLPPLRHSNEIP
ncbi:MAG: hypothetical protein IPG93_08390 [Burkholderiales bacterium]|nr:hypothetical protein [Burkholderiales bacterium]